jgi:methionyl-tRNA synthetase
MIPFQDFQKIELRIGTILSAEPVAGSEKLLKLSVDFGEAAPRHVVSGIAKTYKPVSLTGKQFLFVANLEPRMIMGLESQAMILATENAKGKLILLKPNKKAASGSQLH